MSEESAPPAPVPFARPYVEGFEHLDPDTYDFKHCWTRQNPGKEYNVNDVVMAVIKTAGDYGEMSTLLGRNRQRIRDWIWQHAEVRDIWIDVRESNLDKVELVGMRAALAGDGAQVRFLLATLGKDRGYTTRVESTGKNGGPLLAAVASSISDNPVDAAAQYQKLMSDK